MLKVDEFYKAEKLVDEIIEETPIDNIQSVLENATTSFSEKTRRMFYIHLSSLFLNVILNRLEELGREAETKATRAMQAITYLVNPNQIKHV